LCVRARCQVLGAFAQPRHHYRSGMDPGVSRGTPGTRRIVVDVHLGNTIPFPSAFWPSPRSPRPIVVSQTGIVRTSSIVSKPAVCPRTSPLCCHRSKNSLSRGTNARVRRIENTSITVRDDEAVRAPAKGPFPMQSRSDVLLLVVRPVRLQFPL